MFLHRESGALKSVRKSNLLSLKLESCGAALRAAYEFLILGLTPPQNVQSAKGLLKPTWSELCKFRLILLGHIINPDSLPPKKLCLESLVMVPQGESSSQPLPE
ncbi:hypothetical protein AVEN_219928-1 [Araneus ventricosus]|uniref:Uncharacterized protein n=1 Tax=Araneus ventricosus TaxID=182803 RepID=A0A4Y2TDW4_ARAVE|nr:hypothetical protein AVEN_219928-1 [Araneus ventricosus]